MQHTVLSVLCLKGTMSEAELHLLRARLIGGQLNKARRGELWIRPPLGFVYDDNGRIIFDPDQQVERTVRLLFETFHRTGITRSGKPSFCTSLSCTPAMVTDAIWQPTQAPDSLTLTSLPSTSTSSQSPPSCRRWGRSSSTACSISLIFCSVFNLPPAPAAVVGASGLCFGTAFLASSTMPVG